MVARQGIKSLNLYDIFANIVPGLTLLFGLAVPFRLKPVVKLVFGPETSINLGIAHLLLLLAAAFVLGQLLQAFGGRFDGDHGFGRLIRKIRGEPVNCRYEVTQFENVFWELCKERFVLTDSFNSYDRLFKAILSFLESSDRERALRMQALYLFARGVFVATVSLMLFYLIIFYSLIYGYFPADWEPYFRSELAVGLSAAVAAVIARIMYEERSELEADWIKYTMTEFYLILIDEKE